MFGKTRGHTLKDREKKVDVRENCKLHDNIKIGRTKRTAWNENKKKTPRTIAKVSQRRI